jgi:hypothetical protein
MKKLLLIVLVLAICVLAFPQGVLADTATVNANIDTVTEFHATYDPVDQWALTMGTTDQSDVPIVITVQSNQGWDVNAWDSLDGAKPASTAGHMYEWDGDYVTAGSEMLDTALTIQKEDSTYASLGGAADKVKIADGEASATEFDQNSYLQQYTAAGEKSLLTTNYRIVLTVDITYR